MQIVDSHQHLWDLDLFRYSWLDSMPPLRRSFRMTDYLAAAKGLNVVKTVHLEADVDESYILAETRYLLTLAERKDNPLEGIVAAARPEQPKFRSFLEELARYPCIKGIRRVLHTQPDELGRMTNFIRGVAALADHGFSFDICVLARQLPIAIDLVQKCPEVTFILDHCGVPRVKEKNLDPWRADLAEIAKFQNVFCKISGLAAYADPERWTIEDLRPFVDHTVASFGWERVMFGSDWPVCTLAVSYARWVEILLAITNHAGEDNQKKLFHDNAARIYRLN